MEEPDGDIAHTLQRAEGVITMELKEWLQRALRAESDWLRAELKKDRLAALHSELKEQEVDMLDTLLRGETREVGSYIDEEAQDGIYIGDVMRALSEEELKEEADKEAERAALEVDRNERKRKQQRREADDLKMHQEKTSSTNAVPSPLAAIVPINSSPMGPISTSANRLLRMASFHSSGEQPSNPEPEERAVGERPMGRRASSFDGLAAKITEVLPVSSTKTMTKVYNTAALRDLAHQKIQDKEESIVDRIVESSWFEYTSALVIIACTVMMAVEIQYWGLQSGYDLERENPSSQEMLLLYPLPAAEVWPIAEDMFAASVLVFNSLFLLELTLRAISLKCTSFKSAWMWFDTILVTTSWLDYFELLSFGLDPMMLRLIRLVRIIRLLKVMKTFRAFQTLFLLIRSIQASMGALIWSFMLISCMQISMALFLCQMLAEFIADDSKPSEARMRVHHYFGTFTGAVLTMFEITLANWITPCRTVYEDVHEWYAAIFILYRGCFMFAVIKVITAVFIAETARCTSSDDEVTIVKTQQNKKEFGKKLEEVFNELDVRNSNRLTWKDFETLVHDELMRTWLSTLDIDTQDLEHLFGLLNHDGDGVVTKHEFLSGMTRMRGPAKSIDMLKLINKANYIINRLSDMQKKTEELASQVTLEEVEKMETRILARVDAAVIDLDQLKVASRLSKFDVKGLRKDAANVAAVNSSPKQAHDL